MPEKPTLAFVDHSFHQKTKSGDFIRELLEPYFLIHSYFDTSWDGGPQIPLEEINRHDYVLFEQTFYPLKDLPSITAKIIWVPMYDGFDTSWSFWRYLSHFKVKIISFSQKIHARAERFGVPSFYIQFYQNPELYPTKLPNEGNHLFFWYRGPIRFQDIKPFLNPDSIDSFIYRSNPDPSFGRELISAEDQKRYKMRVIENDYTSREDYLRLVSQTNIYIAPRRKEGIGLSFIEALAMGHAVIGHSDATMSEYITDNKDGFLMQFRQPHLLDFSHLKNIRLSSRERAQAGYKKWEESKSGVVDFIFASFPPHNKNNRATALRLLHGVQSKIPTLKRTIARYKTRIKRILDSRQ